MVEHCSSRIKQLAYWLTNWLTIAALAYAITPTTACYWPLLDLGVFQKGRWLRKRKLWPVLLSIIMGNVRQDGQTRIVNKERESFYERAMCFMAEKQQCRLDCELKCSSWSCKHVQLHTDFRKFPALLSYPSESKNASCSTCISPVKCWLVHNWPRTGKGETLQFNKNGRSTKK